MTERRIDSEIRLIPYYRNDGASLPWYQDLDTCRPVDNRNTPYDLTLLHQMYDYLSAHGDCYYIEYRSVLVGNVSLRDSGEITIEVCMVHIPADAETAAGLNALPQSAPGRPSGCPTGVSAVCGYPVPRGC